MIDRENVISNLEMNIRWISDHEAHQFPGWGNAVAAMTDALERLKEQEDRHRLEVHNIGNVDIPEGVSEEHFYLVMNNVVEALQHTDKGESYPYEDTGR